MFETCRRNCYKMQLFVKSADLHTLNLAGAETVADIKQQVAALEDLSVPDIAVYCRGRPLEDNEIVSVFAEDQSTLDVEIRLLGGKFGVYCLVTYVAVSTQFTSEKLAELMCCDKNVTELHFMLFIYQPCQLIFLLQYIEKKENVLLAFQLPSVYDILVLVTGHFSRF